MPRRKPSLSPSPEAKALQMDLTQRERELLLILVRNAVMLLDATGQHPVVVELVAMLRKLEGLDWPTIKEQIGEMLAKAARP